MLMDTAVYGIITVDPVRNPGARGFDEVWKI